MATLPDAVRHDTPGTHAISIFVGGDGTTWEETWTVTDNNGTPYDLTGITAEFDIRNKLDSRIMLATAIVTDAENGIITVSLTESQVSSLVPSEDMPARGSKLDIGRYNFALADDDGRWVLARGDVWGIR